jgi:hypothetical protein
MCVASAAGGRAPPPWPALRRTARGALETIGGGPIRDTLSGPL